MKFSFSNNIARLERAMQLKNLTLTDFSRQPAPRFRVSPPPFNSLCRFHHELITYFDSLQINEWERLIHAGSKVIPSKSLIYLNPRYSRVLSRNVFMAAPDQLSALAYVLEFFHGGILSAHKNVCIKHREGVLSIETELGGILATISPLSFSLEHRPTTKVSNAIKNLYLYDDPQCYKAQLARIQGFPELSDCSIREESECKTPFVLNACNLARSMRKVINRNTGNDIKLSLAQELTATYFGLPSWNHLRSKEKEVIPSPLYYLTCHHTREPSRLAFTYEVKGVYSGIEKALIGFNETLNQNEISHYHIHNFTGGITFSTLTSNLSTVKESTGFTLAPLNVIERNDEISVFDSEAKNIISELRCKRVLRLDMNI